MHKEYVVIGDEAYVTNEIGEMKKFSKDEINTLEEENSSEYLQKLITNYENEIRFFNDEHKNKQKRSIKLLIFIFAFALWLQVFSNSSFSPFIPATLIGSGIIIVNIANIFVAKMYNEVLSSKLKYVKEKKRKLTNQISLKKETKIENGVIKKIDNSTQINLLRKELELIEQYKSNKCKYLTYYKNGCLGIYMGYLGYHGDSIDFIVRLIEQDLGVKHKQKLLSINEKNI